jgi:hypothetical protein
MSERKIHSQIVKKIRQNSEEDEVIGDFLIDLFYEEAEHSPRWHWRKVYNKRVEQYSQDWSDKDED